MYANFYYMDYDNQLAQTGQLSDIGEALTTNIKDSLKTAITVSSLYVQPGRRMVHGMISCR